MAGGALARGGGGGGGALRSGNAAGRHAAGAAAPCLARNLAPTLALFHRVHPCYNLAYVATEISCICDTGAKKCGTFGGRGGNGDANAAACAVLTEHRTRATRRHRRHIVQRCCGIAAAATSHCSALLLPWVRFYFKVCVAGHKMVCVCPLHAPSALFFWR